MPGREEPGAAPFVPRGASLSELAEAAQSCRGCELYRHATQAVLGSGDPKARIVLIGEQPGDREDRAGSPFVGPAGALLDGALEEAGIPRAEVYITNTVKHFKFVERGKRRIHQKPSAGEVAACHPWLEAELKCLSPSVVVCLGATAAHALLGPRHQLLKERGEFYSHALAPSATATVHPAAILRIADRAQRSTAYSAFLEDLRNVRRYLAKARRAG